MVKNYKKGIIAIIVDEEDNFLIAQLQSYADTEWNFIGGGAEGNEAAEENLRRELQEELGITEIDYEVLKKSSFPLQYEFPSPMLSNNILYHGKIKEQFLVRFKGDKSKIKIQEEEIRKLKWVKFSELEEHLIFPDQYSSAIKTLKEIYPQVIPF